MTYFPDRFCTKRFKAVLVGIIAFCVMTPVSVFAKQYSLTIELSYHWRTKEMSFSKMYLWPGEASISSLQEPDGYSLTLQSRAREHLFTTSFSAPGPLTDVLEPQEESTFSVTVPFLLDARTIAIDDPAGKLIVTIPIPPVEQLAEETLRAVTRSTSTAADISVLVPGGVESAEKDKPKKSFTQILPQYALGAVAVAFALAIFVFVVKRIHRKKPTDPPTPAS